MRLPRRPIRNFSASIRAWVSFIGRKGKSNLAKQEFETELKRYPTDPVSHCLLGQILRKQNDPGEALRHFRAAIAANPNYKEALFELGKSELMLNQPKEAIEPLRKAIELDPNYVQAHYSLGTALRKLGRSAEASREIAMSEQIQARERAQTT